MNIQSFPGGKAQDLHDYDIAGGVVRRSMFWAPERQAPSAWIEHVPFAFWLVDVLRPRRIVELGTHTGVSYSAMCQAVKTLGLATSCFAIDIWKGDEHAGFYDEEVYQDLAKFHDQRFSGFSQLLRSTFDDALPYFEDGSIDLLHIDGLHTYEAVRHDYQSWLPKLATNAVVLFHDTNVRERDFGVFRLWKEITADRLHFSFLHGHGLGVLAHGQDFPAALHALFAANQHTALLSTLREVFARLGRSARLETETSLLVSRQVEQAAVTADLKEILGTKSHELDGLRNLLNTREGELHGLRDLLNAREGQLNQIIGSHSWKLTRPFRFGGRLLRGDWSLPLAALRTLARSTRRAAAPRSTSKSLETTPQAEWSIAADSIVDFPEPRGATIERYLRRTLGNRISLYIGSSTTLRSARERLRRLEDSSTHKQAYLLHAQHALGTHSPHYGARASKPAPTERAPFRLIAYYLPQYHPIPENDSWWGAGFTEWRNVGRAFPVFTGHHQPRLPGELGYYDLRIPEVMSRQIQLAKMHGISAFCFHFYWFGGKRLLERPIEDFLRNTDHDFKFCLCWANENWTRRWDGADHEVLIGQSHSAEDDIALIRYMQRYFDDPRYVRIDGKPVLTIYRPDILPDAKRTVDRWRKEAERAGLPGLYLVATNSFGFGEYEKYGFDAISEFPPHGLNLSKTTRVPCLHPDYKGNIYSYAKALEYVLTTFKPSKPPQGRVVFPGAMPGWDNTPRRPLNGNVFHGPTPALFYQWLTHSVARVTQNNENERLIFINAWNEWAEGAYLEPDRTFGYSYLAACAAVVADNTEVDAGVTSLFKQQRNNFKRLHRRAVAIHLYYEDLAEWFAEKVEAFGDVDVYITVPRTISLESAKNIANIFSYAYILEVDNRGRDIRPFFLLYKQFLDGDYEFVCKLHSKKSAHLRDGHQWRVDMVDQLLAVDARNALDSAVSSTGILASRGTLENLRDPNVRIRSQRNLITLATRLDYHMTFTETFVAGSMFWFRPKALQNLYRLFVDGLDFEPELGQVDGTLAHAIERIFCIASSAASMSVQEFGKQSIQRPSQWA